MRLSSRGVVFLIAIVVMATTRCVMACSDLDISHASAPKCHHQSKSDPKPANTPCPSQTLTVVTAEKAVPVSPVQSSVHWVPSWQGVPKRDITAAVSMGRALPPPLAEG